MQARDFLLSAPLFYLLAILKYCSYGQYINPMHHDPSLPRLLQRPDLWRARQAPAVATNDDPGTGFAELDRALHGGGWPADGLVELLSPGAVPALMRLLLPAMAAVEHGLVVLASPPARPHTRTLRRAGLDPERLLILHSRDGRMLLRACREAAASDSVAILVAWLPRGLDEPKTLRRLHLAARQGRCRLFLVRDDCQAAQPSPAPLRLRIRPCLPGDLEVEIHKQAGGRAGQRVRLAILPETLRTPPGPTARMPAPQQAWRPSGETMEERRPALPVAPPPMPPLSLPETIR